MSSSSAIYITYTHNPTTGKLFALFRQDSQNHGCHQDFLQGGAASFLGANARNFAYKFTLKIFETVCTDHCSADFPKLTAHGPPTGPKKNHTQIKWSGTIFKVKISSTDRGTAFPLFPVHLTKSNFPELLNKNMNSYHHLLDKQRYY
jgi:hypothetical protein